MLPGDVGGIPGPELRLQTRSPSTQRGLLQEAGRMSAQGGDGMKDRTAEEIIVTRTRRWLERAVIGLNLCPFAKPAYTKDQIRYAVSGAETPEALLAELIGELQTLAATDPGAIETTLLIHPAVLTDFLDYNDFLGV